MNTLLELRDLTTRLAVEGELRPVLQALRHGRMIGILMDQNAARREGVFVDFFGRAASTSRSMALLAVRTQTPIVPVCRGTRRGSKNYTGR